MKQNMFIIILISFLWSDQSENDVNHLIVNYKGETIDCFIDSFGYEYLFYTQKDSFDLDSIKLRKVYYVYNDLNRVFHYSWSFLENIRRMENRTGNLYTISGDTINFINLKFYHDMIKPEIFINKNSTKSEFYPLLEIEKIETDFSIMSYSVKRGFYYSLSLFILSTLIEINTEWKNGRRLIPSMANQFDDLMPMVDDIGLRDAGATYESLTSFIPISVSASMIYDIIRNKNMFYFTPVYEEHIFGRNMYVFSLKHIFKTRFQSIVYKIESTKIGGKVVAWLRKKVN